MVNVVDIEDQVVVVDDNADADVDVCIGGGGSNNREARSGGKYQVLAMTTGGGQKWK